MKRFAACVAAFASLTVAPVAAQSTGPSLQISIIQPDGSSATMNCTASLLPPTDTMTQLQQNGGQWAGVTLFSGPAISQTTQQFACY